MHTFLALLAAYAFVLGLYGIAAQVKAVCRWIAERSRFR
jgi:hypothetical protein